MMSTDKKMQFYQLLRDFLTDYLVTRRNFSDKTVRAYKQSLKLLGANGSLDFVVVDGHQAFAQKLT